MTPDASEPEPRFERFVATYPATGTAIECWYHGGATLAEVRILHPLATVEAVEDSRVAPPSSA
jgi:hypothetical protein